MSFLSRTRRRLRSTCFRFNHSIIIRHLEDARNSHDEITCPRDATAAPDRNKNMCSPDEDLGHKMTQLRGQKSRLQSECESLNRCVLSAEKQKKNMVSTIKRFRRECAYLTKHMKAHGLSKSLMIVPEVPDFVANAQPVPSEEPSDFTRYESELTRRTRVLAALEHQLGAQRERNKERVADSPSLAELKGIMDAEIKSEGYDLSVDPKTLSRSLISKLRTRLLIFYIL